ncbi:hypothetical protein [Nocardioides antri]|uniref:Uncharacterized protein n=1 Tax=Nocardioides antri TaxID=2607659 RepID=A0A5B1M915_9ACTN|nr:hypothetical protein [Nocardioides antri]KAA1429313.1 hypothetical protein F0U47_03755 [Nocardioides antri]
MDEQYDAVERWDDELGDLLAGRGGRAVLPTEQWLASAARPTVPGTVVARVDHAVGVVSRRDDRPSRWLTVVAIGLAAAFVFQGVGNLVAGEWVADNLGEPYAPHPFREGGLAMIAIGVCAAAGAVSRRWSTASVLTCTPLAIGLGLHGFTEVGVFAAGVALHLTEGTLGILLAVCWWLDRRDRAAARREVRT